MTTKAGTELKNVAKFDDDDEEDVEVGQQFDPGWTPEEPPLEERMAPEMAVYDLCMWSADRLALQSMDLTRDEYIALRRGLAAMRRARAEIGS